MVATATPETRPEADEPRQTRCFYVRDDLIADVDAIMVARRGNGVPRLKRSHVIEEAVEQWLALNSRKYDFRITAAD